MNLDAPRHRRAKFDLNAETQRSAESSLAAFFSRAPRRSCRAFSLIEMMIVLAIIMVALGIAFAATRGQQRQSKVRAAAEELASVLAKARHLAMSRGCVIGVAFNIENAPGSTGRVLNNRSGGHWYRMIGPSPFLRSNPSIPDSIPWGAQNYGHFPMFIEEIKRSWIGESVVLPPGQVRILAIGDTDEGPRVRGATASNGAPYGATYPRPWFGYYDTTAKRLYPWGGYDATIANSGFHYQGADGAIIGCRNVSDRAWNAPFKIGNANTDYFTYTLANQDLNGDGDRDDYGETEVAYPVWKQGEPRPLVNAAWLDATILFLPNGTVRFGEWNRGRRLYRNSQGQRFNDQAWGRNGVSDRAKPCPFPSPPGPTDQRWLPTFTDLDYEYRDDIPEVAHFDRHTGGWYITLAPDVRDDNDTFADERAAIASIRPAWRVFVGRNGSVRALPVANPVGWLTGRTAWPANPTVWSGAANTTTDPLWRDCRLGWLNQANTGGAGSSAKLIPRGKPITEVLCAPMLSQRVWWLDE